MVAIAVRLVLLATTFLTKRRGTVSIKLGTEQLTQGTPNQIK